MEDDKNRKSESGGQTKKRVLAWVVGGCTVVAAVVGLAFILTTPRTPAEVAEQYIEDHYDAVAETVVHAAFLENPLKVEIIAGIASVAKQVIPYSCQVISETGTIVDARCNLSFSFNQPLEIRIDAPFRVSMSTVNRDVFGRAMLVVAGLESHHQRDDSQRFQPQKVRGSRSGGREGEGDNRGSGI